MKRERVNRAFRNEAQISVAERNLTAAKARVQYWEQRLSKLQEEELTIRLESHLPLGRHTRKNTRKYIVWQSVRLILLEAEAGLTTAELYQAASTEHRVLNLVTFRKYLREFCSPERRLIAKIGDRWQLTLLVKGTQLK